MRRLRWLNYVVCPRKSHGLSGKLRSSHAILDLGMPRPDLAQLSDEELIDRFNAALDAYEDVKADTALSASSSTRLAGITELWLRTPTSTAFPSTFNARSAASKDEMERRAAARRPQADMRESIGEGSHNHLARVFISCETAPSKAEDQT